MQSIANRVEFTTPLQEFAIELKRLRRMKKTKRIFDPTRIAHLWMKLRSRTYRKEWLRAKSHWFQGATSLDAVVEQNLAHLMEAQSSFRDKFINFDEDLNMMKVDFASSRASTSVSSEVA